MTNKHQYQIILKPLSKYFFGGEHYYDNEDGVFYFERSREYPQQTSVLGVLRYQLLLEGGLLQQTNYGAKIRDKVAAISLIGDKSFDGITTRSFGKICTLSPVIIIDENGEYWFDYPKAKVKDKETQTGLEELKLEVLPNGRLYMGNHLLSEIPQWIKFDHKEGLEYGLLNIPSRTYLRNNEVFSHKVRKEEQIGIYKPYRKSKTGVVEETEDHGFYKYQYCQLNKGYSFSCFAQADEPLPLRNTIVRLGKERTPFEMTITEAVCPFENNTILPGSQVLLLSDAYLDGDWGQYCKAAIADLVPFKNLRYQVNQTDNYDSEPPKPDKRLNLLKRGSLLWVSDKQSDAEELQKMFENETIFLNIGYNHYEVIKNHSA